LIYGLAPPLAESLFEVFSWSAPGRGGLALYALRSSGRFDQGLLRARCPKWAARRQNPNHQPYTHTPANTPPPPQNQTSTNKTPHLLKTHNNQPTTTHNPQTHPPTHTHTTPTPPLSGPSFSHLHLEPPLFKSFFF